MQSKLKSFDLTKQTMSRNYKIRVEKLKTFDTTNQITPHSDLIHKNLADFLHSQFNVYCLACEIYPHFRQSPLQRLQDYHTHKPEA